MAIISDNLGHWTGPHHEDTINRIFELTRAELRRIAARLLRNEHNLTIPATDLIHRVYERMRRVEDPDFPNRRAFYAFAATHMRRILVDLVRERNAERRGGGVVRVSLDATRSSLDSDDAPLEAADPRSSDDLDLVEYHELLERLAEIDPHAPQTAQLIDLRVMFGLTHAEAAEALGISKATVERRWKFAAAWLRTQLGRTPAGSDDR